MDGKPVGPDVVPPMEFHLHSEIYRRRPDVNAVAHTHPAVVHALQHDGRSACSR